ncbi:MAG: hypothetical protein RMK91_08170 [Pseudanabaenaceae cyanobacterium SKYGB_i_bin29]|nr:hypothetical protein [Pseudanabaenaceae cyanobacterium SKYG29]MDW8421830.1 hypothetical protein [Pseudanabaenaceae cyanobacterium SKYGB_i_bin29]
MDIKKFICPIAPYWGVKDPFNCEFNIHLQVFAQRVSLLAGLHTGGKLSTAEVTQQLLAMWGELQPYLQETDPSCHKPELLS